ncbi:MAG: LUD domain-containing protein [Deltaproteobacteria bacterium]|nr:LUD domain-containing protein [Deltaproteobacteria bacterium]
MRALPLRSRGLELPIDRRAAAVLPEAALARHDAAVWQLRVKRDAAVAAVPDFEALRTRAAALKDHALDHLDLLLERFEAQARAAGAVVHWASDARGLCETVEALLRAHGATLVVKSKSMLTEECGLNPWLEARGFEVVDTDLGERIVQLGHEPPSHLIVPAIHRTRGEIGALFERTMGSPAGETDPARLMAVAREALRARFLVAQAGISGANFAIAETGSLVLVTNEGNADLGTALPPLHVACVGIEKLVPTLDDAAVLLRLLARSATGQPISAYTTVLTGPRPGGELHVVLVDNGRSRLLAHPGRRRLLRCIRCGACLNTCPVYRRAGGHAYGTAVGGPIGAALAPALAPQEGGSLPWASSLCGSCTAVCPVRIDLHEQLLAWRLDAPQPSPAIVRYARLAAYLLAHPRLWRAATRLARLAWPLLGTVPAIRRFSERFGVRQ